MPSVVAPNRDILTVVLLEKRMNNGSHNTENITLGNTGERDDIRADFQYRRTRELSKTIKLFVLFFFTSKTVCNCIKRGCKNTTVRLLTVDSKKDFAKNDCTFKSTYNI